jgi:hypothetical protein
MGKGESMTTSCPHCGAKIGEGVQFCGACGKPIGDQAVGVQPKQQSVVAGQTHMKSLPKWAWWVGGGVIGTLVLAAIVLGFVFAGKIPILGAVAGILSILVWIGVTALGAYVAFKKKRKVLGILCIVTLIYGFIFAIIAFFISPKPPVTQISEKCPRCTGQLGTEEQTKLDQHTNKRSRTLALAILWSVLGGLFLVICLVLAIGIWIEGDGGIIEWAYGSTIAGMGVMVVGFGLGGTGLRYAWEYKTTERVDGVAFSCSMCKFKWEHPLGAPAGPAASVLPTGQPPVPPA